MVKKKKGCTWSTTRNPNTQKFVAWYQARFTSRCSTENYMTHNLQLFRGRLTCASMTKNNTTSCFWLMQIAWKPSNIYRKNGADRRLTCTDYETYLVGESDHVKSFCVHWKTSWQFSDCSNTSDHRYRVENEKSNFWKKENCAGYLQ